MGAVDGEVCHCSSLTYIRCSESPNLQDVLVGIRRVCGTQHIPAKRDHGGEMQCLSSNQPERDSSLCLLTRSWAMNSCLKTTGDRGTTLTGLLRCNETMCVECCVWRMVGVQSSVALKYKQSYTLGHCQQWGDNWVKGLQHPLRMTGGCKPWAGFAVYGEAS